MMTRFVGVPRAVPSASMARTTDIPSVTLPKTTCLPFNHGVSAVVMKNCDPFVFGPALAIDRHPTECGMANDSSGKVRP